MEIIVNIPLRLSVKLSVNGSARVVLGSNQVSLNSQEYQRSSFSFFGKTVNIWNEAIRTGRPAGSNFGYSGPLTQVALLGLIAIRFPGQTLHWDNKAMKFTNNKAANALLRTSYRSGWHL